MEPHRLDKCRKVTVDCDVDQRGRSLTGLHFERGAVAGRTTSFTGRALGTAAAGTFSATVAPASAVAIVNQVLH